MQRGAAERGAVERNASEAQGVQGRERAVQGVGGLAAHGLRRVPGGVQRKIAVRIDRDARSKPVMGNCTALPDSKAAPAAYSSGK